MIALYPWQQSLWDSLQQRKQQQRLPHALLFLGQKGVGKNQLAKALAWSLLCAHPNEEGMACGQCKSCRLLSTGAHADLLMVSPEEDHKEIRIDQIRALSQAMALTAQHAGNRVAVISPAHTMNTKAANSLLKTLEEPMPDAYLLLVADHLDSLPVTVRSRCQLVHCHIPAQADAIDWLQSQETAATDWDLNLGLQGGAPLASLDWVRSGADTSRLQRFSEFESLVKGKANPVEVAERWLKDGVEAPLQQLGNWLQDMIRIASASEAAHLQNRDVANALQSLTQGVSLESLFALLDYSWQARVWLRTQANTQLLLEDVLIRCARLKRVVVKAT